MFDKRVSFESAAGEADAPGVWCDDDFDDLVYLITESEMSAGWVDDDRLELPELESLAPDRLLHAILSSVDPRRLNGFDLVRVLQAQERLVSHAQAEAVAIVHEMAYAAPGGADSDVDRLTEPSEFAADELRPALNITRRAAENRMSLAFDLCQRLPVVWELLHDGAIDLGRARVIAEGTAHLDWDEARAVAETVSNRASRLTTGQLAAWLRRLCVESDPEKAKRRYEQAMDDRKLWIEQTSDGTGNLHLLDIDIADARAIGRRVNAHMISHRRDGDTRSHDQLRADIAVDLLLGGDPTNGGRGSMEMRVSMTTLAGLDEMAAEIPGMGPVVAEVARKFADRHHKAEWRAVITDERGDVIDIVTTARRPTKAISDWTNADQPVCSFPGCRVPARDCDFDHLLPVALRGPTSTRNGGPKCRHDHVLKDKGWTHQRIHDCDRWTSPLGHTYITEKPP